jgi:hypothetical protein
VLLDDGKIAAWVCRVQYVVCDVAVQIWITRDEAEWVLAYETPEARVIEAGAVVVERKPGARWLQKLPLLLNRRL